MEREKDGNDTTCSVYNYMALFKFHLYNCIFIRQLISNENRILNMKYLKLHIPLLLIILFCFAFKLQEYTVNEDRFVIHTVNPKEKKLKFHWKSNDGAIYGSIKNLKDDFESSGLALKFAVNGGMYMKDQSPQGVFIQNGKILSPIAKTTSGYGNFYLQPNGVFGLTTDYKAFITKTTDFKIDSSIAYATQSGPMLLIHGAYHTKLKKGSKNLHIRNGVGILPDGNVLFAMSKEKTNFYDLATFFKQNGCLNALYLDGFVSRTYLPSKNSNELGGNFGVIIAEEIKN